jgi:glycosyltransferase involved in cell wall biosynthesis
MPKLSELTPAYGAMLRETASDAEVIVVSHPYLLYEVLHVNGQARIIYEAHNVESDLKRNVLPKQAKTFIDDVYRIEKMCCEQGDKIITCSTDDANRLQQLYGIGPGKFFVVPNGVDVETIPFVTQQQRRVNKRKLGLENEGIVLFMGSWHPPNLEAANRVFEIAQALPKIKFLLMGSQCLAFEGKVIPVNVGLLGVLEENEKSILFGIVDLALNPMLSGSGTNLKMFDYMAAGIPVVSTEFGARGIDFTHDKEILVANVEDMSKAITDAFHKSDEALMNISVAARQLVEEKYDWKTISEVVRIELESRLWRSMD